ncbi:hypothetical protein [Streptomyces sp. NPDC000405]|uniref:hypothetical protein n=1 Tax=Streptomyces sp. NPDC000405 TaxID=3161033 RepID=UPI00398D3013
MAKDNKSSTIAQDKEPSARPPVSDTGEHSIRRSSAAGAAFGAGKFLSTQLLERLHGWLQHLIGLWSDS